MKKERQERRNTGVSLVQINAAVVVTMPDSLETSNCAHGNAFVCECFLGQEWQCCVKSTPRPSPADRASIRLLRSSTRACRSSDLWGLAPLDEIVQLSCWRGSPFGLHTTSCEYVAHTVFERCFQASSVESRLGRLAACHFHVCLVTGRRWV